MLEFEETKAYQELQKYNQSLDDDHPHRDALKEYESKDYFQTIIKHMFWKADKMTADRFEELLDRVRAKYGKSAEARAPFEPSLSPYKCVTKFISTLADDDDRRKHWAFMTRRANLDILYDILDRIDFTGDDDKDFETITKIFTTKLFDLQADIAKKKRPVIYPDKKQLFT